MTKPTVLHLFRTPSETCGYLPHLHETLLVVDPRQKINAQLYGLLMSQGFRRSGKHIYRPGCSACRACISCRIPVTAFTPNRSQRRVMKINRDLRIIEAAPKITPEIYALYKRYIASRHSDSDMWPTSREQFDAFLFKPHRLTRQLEFRLEERLLAVALMDIMKNATSAIYTFFDPDYKARSLGSYCILKQISMTRARGLDFLYLGYWIRDCQKMNYKTNYLPTQLLINGKWVELQSQRELP